MNLTDREKKLIFTAGIFFVILVVYFLGTFISDNIFSLDEKIQESEAEEKNLTEYGNEYKKLASLRSMDRIDLEPMVPFIEGLIQKYGLSSAANIQPNDSVIENKYTKRQVNIMLKEIDAASLLNIIKEVENQSSIPFTFDLFQYFELKEKPGYYRVTMRVAAFKNKDQ
jgi:hypothetical protein